MVGRRASREVARGTSDERPTEDRHGSGQGRAAPRARGGYDLTEEAWVGKITFTQMTYLMLVGRFPSDDEGADDRRLLTILVEHGMVASVVAARITYHTAPEGAIQGAVAAALLGAGSVHLGSSEWCAKMLQEGRRRGTSSNPTWTPSRRRSWSATPPCASGFRGSATAPMPRATRAPRYCSRSRARRACTAATATCCRRSRARPRRAAAAVCR